MSSGIYLIRNTVNNKIYIGSTKNLKTRQQQHFSDLRCKRHANQHLQASFNKHGEQCFEFKIIKQDILEEDLLNVEQEYINIFKPEYNICEKAGRPPKFKWTEEQRKRQSEQRKGKPPHPNTIKASIAACKGVKFSEERLAKHTEIMRNRTISDESRKILSETAKRIHKGAKRSETTKLKISQALVGRRLSEEHRKKCGLARLGKKLTEEHKQQIREVHSKDYIVISPIGERHEISGLFLFAKQHGLDESALASCARGEYKHHKGWQCFRIEDFSEDKVQDPSSFRIKGATVYVVTKPDGTEETTNNLYEFARLYDLDGSSLCKVFKGKLPHHKQYRVREQGTELQALPKRKKPTIDSTNTHHFICTAPDGTEYTTTNMPEFAREHGICKESMRLVAKGRLRQYKGWLCRYTPETLAKLTPEQQAEVQANFEYQAKYPDGKPISAEDKQRIIDASRTPEALEKRSKQRKGWKPTEQQVQNLSLGHCKRTFIITTPYGVEHTTKQLVQFAKNLNISSTGLYKSLKTGKSCKGYTVREVFDDVI